MARVTRNHYTGTPEIDWDDVPKMEAHLARKKVATRALLQLVEG